MKNTIRLLTKVLIKLFGRDRLLVKGKAHTRADWIYSHYDLPHSVAGEVYDLSLELKRGRK
jgi:hypothetical protein